MTYVQPVPMLASQTVLPSHWNRLVNNQQDMNTRLAALELLSPDPPDYSSFPIGAVVAFYRAAQFIPAGWHICDGGTYDTYVTPDLRGMFIYGCAESDDSDLLDTGGAATHTHTNPSTSAGNSHTHTATGNTGAPSAYSNAYPGGGLSVASSGHSHSYNITTQSGGSHGHTVSDTAAGSSLPPYVKLYWITRTA